MGTYKRRGVGCGRWFEATQATAIRCSVCDVLGPPDSPVKVAGCQACVIGACDDHQRPPVCVCDTPLLAGGCLSCTRNHMPDECRRCHRPYKPQVPGFDQCRDAWIAQLTREAS